jgi:hypothetical protein
MKKWFSKLYYVKINKMLKRTKIVKVVERLRTYLDRAPDGGVSAMSPSINLQVPCDGSCVVTSPSPWKSQAAGF